jgi:hypothetical protein
VLVVPATASVSEQMLDGNLIDALVIRRAPKVSAEHGVWTKDAIVKSKAPPLDQREDSDRSDRLGDACNSKQMRRRKRLISFSIGESEGLLVEWVIQMADCY